MKTHSLFEFHFKHSEQRIQSSLDEGTQEHS